MALTNSYLDVAEFKVLSTAPAALVDGEHIPAANVAGRAAWTSFVESRLQFWTARIDSRLRKRYATPFPLPAPNAVRGWLSILVTPDLYRKRGWDPSDEHAKDLIEASDTVLSDLEEAANAQNGLFDLPLRDDGDASAIEKGTPLSYSEASPYEFMDVQREAVYGR